MIEFIWSIMVVLGIAITILLVFLLMSIVTGFFKRFNGGNK